MKFLAFVDFHDNEDDLIELRVKAKEVDFILCLGDYTFFGQNENAVLKNLNSLLLY